MIPAHRTLGMLALGVSLSACGGPLPVRLAWLDDLIVELEAAPVANPPAEIVRRVHDAGVYYYLLPRCCGVWSNLYSADGTLVCHPDGGITGNGDGLCSALGPLVSEEVVWQDPGG